jgi:vacuolar-type H+-ATPase subunit F/Vma7
MSETIVALGEQSLLEGFPLAGVELRVAETDHAVQDAWALLPKNARVVILTPRAAGALGAIRDDPRSPMTVVLPL